MRSLVVVALLVAGCSNAKRDEERVIDQKRIAAAEAATREAEDRAQAAEDRTKALEARVAALEARPLHPTTYYLTSTNTPIPAPPFVIGSPCGMDRLRDSSTPAFAIKSCLRDKVRAGRATSEEANLLRSACKAPYDAACIEEINQARPQPQALALGLPASRD